MIHGKDLTTRLETLRLLKADTSKILSKHNLKTSDTENRDFKVYQVPIDFLLYRISNYSKNLLLHEIFSL